MYQIVTREHYFVKSILEQLYRWPFQIKHFYSELISYILLDMPTGHQRVKY